MRQKFLFILALLLTAVTGAWADEWDVVYWQTQTKQSDWTALSAGSTQKGYDVEIVHDGGHLLMGEAYARLTKTK